MNIGNQKEGKQYWIRIRRLTMELEYIKTGDYYIPTLMANKEPEEALTKYGLMRKTYTVYSI